MEIEITPKEYILYQKENTNLRGITGNHNYLKNISKPIMSVEYYQVLRQTPSTAEDWNSTFTIN